MPKVSVIVPNYNHAPYLAQRIDTILAQTYRDFELLIMDDASPDTSREVAQRYAGDRRVAFAFNETNSGGTYLQWRKGLALTSGEYVWIAESDDFAEPTLLERLVGLLDANPRVGLATCDSWRVDERGAALGRCSDDWRRLDSFAGQDTTPLFSELVMDGRAYLREFMVPWNTILNASAIVFRRAAFEAIGGPVTDMKLCGDWLTYCKMLMHFDIARVPEPLNHFRQHAVSVRTRSKAALYVRESMAVQAFVAKALGLGDRIERLPRVRTFFCQCLLALERDRSSNKVPLRRVPAVAREAAAFGPAILRGTLKILLWEQAAALARALGLRR